jgi:hypothetical protein
MPSKLINKLCFINCELRTANCFDNPPQSIKKRIAALDTQAINYLLGR